MATCLHVSFAKHQVCGRKIWVQLNRGAALFDSVIIFLREVVSECHPRADHEVEWVKFQCLFRFESVPRRAGPLLIDNLRTNGEHLHIGIQLQCTLELSLRASPIPSVVKNQTQGGVSFGRLRVDFNRLAGRSLSSGKSLRWRRETVPRESAVAIGQSLSRRRHRPGPDLWPAENKLTPSACRRQSVCSSNSDL